MDPLCTPPVLAKQIKASLHETVNMISPAAHTSPIERDAKLTHASQKRCASELCFTSQRSFTDWIDGETFAPYYAEYERQRELNPKITNAKPSKYFEILHTPLMKWRNGSPYVQEASWIF